MSDPDQDVIRRWTKGSKKAFEQLVKRYMQDAFMIAMSYAGNAEDARDLSQDAFIKAYQARGKFDPERPFFPWFYRILKNHCLNFVQRSRKRTESLYYEDEPGRERFASDKPTALDDLERDERVRMMRVAIDRLNGEHREVILLKNFQGYSYKQMADTLDIPIGTVMSRLYYARKALKEVVGDIESGENAERSSEIPPGNSTPRGEVN